MKALIWTPRILTVAILGLFALFFVGEGPPRFSRLTPVELRIFAVNGLAFVGLLLGWRYPGVGGILALASYFVLAILLGPRAAFLRPFVVIGIAAVLYIINWLAQRGLMQPRSVEGRSGY